MSRSWKGFLGLTGVFWVILLAPFGAGGSAVAQQRDLGVVAMPSENFVVLPATSIASVLRSLASRAGIVFVGQVERIVPNGGVVEITFQVQQPVIGVVGGTYVLREWAGRWTGGQQRYRVGQRAMFFLHAPSAAGLSSPVDGMMGIVPLVPVGAGAPPMLDARWLATRVTRSVGSPMTTAETGAITLADAETVVKSWKVISVPEPVGHPLPIGVRSEPVLPLSVKAPLLEQLNVAR